MNQAQKQLIKDFLKGKGFTAGGIIEDAMRDNYAMKGDTTSRVLRFMWADGTVEKEYRPREKGRSYVVYRLKETVPYYQPKLLLA